MLFSATMTDKVEDLVKLALKKPVRLFVNENTEISLKLKQEYIRIRSESREFEREAIVSGLISRTFPKQTIVFVRTRKDCERIHVILGHFGINVGQLHGGLSQLQRIETLSSFKQQTSVEVLCATDLAARGLDIEGIVTVINMHMPPDVTRYIHRVGRTARAGTVGRAISLIGEKDRNLFKQITKLHHESLVQRTVSQEIIEAYMTRIKYIQTPNARNQTSSDPIKNSQIPVATNIECDIDQSQGSRKALTRKKCRNSTKSEIKESSKDEPSYTSEITNIGRRAVKCYRHGPDDMEFKRSKREMMKRNVIKKRVRNG